MLLFQKKFCGVIYACSKNDLQLVCTYLSVQYNTHLIKWPMKYLNITAHNGIRLH